MAYASEDYPFNDSEDECLVQNLLARWRLGDAAAGDALFTMLDPELKQIVRRYYRNFGSVSFNPSDLYSEFALKLLNSKEKSLPAGRAHFLALASTMMYQIVIDHARKVARRPERADFTVFERLLNESGIPDDRAGLDAKEILALAEALENLETVAPRQAAVVRHFYFGALSMEEIGAAMSVSRATAVRDLKKARAFLLAIIEK